MKYVKKVIKPNGAIYVYFRKKGHPNDGQQLKSPWPEVEEGSALEAEISAVLGLQPVKPKTTNLAGAIRDYELSADFKNLGDGTKREYGYLLRNIDDEFGACMIAAFTPAKIQELRNYWAERGHKAANDRLLMLKAALNPVMISLDLPDPFTRIKNVRRPNHKVEPHVVWNDEVLRAVTDRAVEERLFGLARAVMIGRYAGARRGDLVRIGQANRQDKRLRWLSGKRRVPVDMRERTVLTDWLDRLPAFQPPSKWQLHVQRKTRVFLAPPRTLVFNTRNQPYTESGLGQALAEVVTALHMEGWIDNDRYNLHGLRHTFGVEGALAGWTDAQGMALMGHKSEHQFAAYRRQANRLRLSDAGMALMQGYDGEPGTGAEREATTECQQVTTGVPTNLRVLARKAQ